MHLAGKNAVSPSRAMAALLVLALLSTLAVITDTEPARAAVPINRNRIRQVLYPTLGFPAIIESGEQLTIEFDPRDQDWSLPLPGLTGFEARVTTTNSDYPVVKALPVEHYAIGYSTRWPEFSQAREPRARVYLVTVTVPKDVPLHLYDLTVRGKLDGGGWLEDSQPHALQSIEEYKDDFSVGQLTDIHVWGPEAAYPGSLSTHLRNYRHADYRAGDGYGAAFYHKSIQQMNREKPDFIIYTGDYDFSQKWLYKQDYSAFSQYKNSPWNGKYYEPHFEMDWFYQETLKLDVPVFMVLGNHDGYARYDFFNANLEEDYMSSWRNLFSPQYFSFDYGPDYHFTAMNTMDWTSADRNLHWAVPDVILNPGKWQGQVRSGGDKWQAGWTQARENAINENNFTDQLLWAKTDLEAHAGAKMRVIAAHHDPWKKDGSGMMFDDASMFGLINTGGKGEGRLATIKLARENHVSMFISGHDHSDSYGAVAWTGGGGEVKFINSTSTTFQDAPNTLSPDWSRMWVYPGYRLLTISNGNLVNFYYKLANDQGGHPLQYSWPFYSGTNVGGETNFANLNTPAVESLWTPSPGAAEDVTCRITNHLTGYEVLPGGEWSGDLEDASMEFPMPVLSGGYYYAVTAGAFGEIYDDTTGGHRVYQVTTDVEHAADESTPTVKDLKVDRSATPDGTAPTCAAFQIDGGAPSTTDAEVTLTNDAVDLGGSGLLDMMISNDDPSFSGDSWQRYQATTDWTLKKEAGARSVYIKFRDAAMPGNVSAVKQSTITLVGDPPTITSVDPGAAFIGEQVEITGTDFGEPRTEYDKVYFNGVFADVVSWEDTRIVCTVPHGVCTGILTVLTDAGSDSAEFHVKPVADSITPSFGYNTGTAHIENLEGTGFYSEGSYPDVKIWNGTNEIFASNIEVVSPQSISCDFELDGAAVGVYNVIVQNDDGWSATLSGGFCVDYPPPTVAGITPKTGAGDGVVAITNLAGTGFRSGLEAWLKKGGTEIKATGLTVVSGGKVTCKFDLTGAALGPWDVYVENDDLEGGTLAGGFDVQQEGPPQSTWYLAEGSTAWGYDTYVSITNPNTEGVSVRVTYMTAGGQVAGGTHSLAPRSQLTINPGSAVGNTDFSTSVECLEGSDIAVDRTMSWDTEAHNSIGVTSPASTWYMPEGCSAFGFETWLLIQNPGARAANCHVTYMVEGEAPVTVEKTVPANSRQSFNMESDIGKANASIKVSSDVPVVTERSVYRNGNEEGHCSIGAVAPAADFYLAEGTTAWGFETWLLIQNPNAADARVSVTFMTPGGPVDQEPFTVPAQSRKTVKVSDVPGMGNTDCSIKVHSSAPILAERAMYWNNGAKAACHDSIGMSAPHKVFVLPDGQTSEGRQTYTLVQNPNGSDVTVSISYLTETGQGSVTFTDVIEANSRKTYDMSDRITSGRASVLVTCPRPIMAERSMYWGERGFGTDTVGGFAD